MAIIGIDYASVDENKTPDTDALRRWGCRFAILRGAYQYGGFRPDAHLARDRDRLKAVGITLGAYLILDYSGSVQPEKQAEIFASAYGARQPGELPPWLDVEFPRGRLATGMSAQDAMAWIERAYAVLQGHYGIVGTYTSQRVWSEDLGDLPSRLGAGPLWIKVPYPYRARQPVHLESQGSVGRLPVPWRDLGSPGVWIVQFQGDALGVPGMSSTVDVNRWVTPTDDTPWLRSKIGAQGQPWRAAVSVWQTVNGLVSDGIVGPATFSMLTQ